MERNMRKRDRRELERYIRWMANEMELRDWTITLADDPCSPGNKGECLAVMGRKRATILLAKDFRSHEPEDQRVTIVHELLHCHWTAAWEMVGRDLEKALGSQADIIFCSAFDRNAEYAIDATAAALAKHLPLIDWPPS
jgi:hypothetical protein